METTIYQGSRKRKMKEKNNKKQNMLISFSKNIFKAK